MTRERKNNKSTLKKVLHYVGKYWFFVVVSILLAAVSALLTLYVPIIIGDTIDFIIDKGNVDFSMIYALLKKAGIVVLITAFSSPPDFFAIRSRTGAKHQRFAKMMRYKNEECLPRVSNISAAAFVIRRLKGFF